MLRTHRQRVPAMMAVACVGMMVYGLAGAAPDGTELAPASCDAATSCAQPAAKSGDKSTSTTGKGKAGTSKDPCDASSGGKGDSGSTPTTGTDGKGDPRGGKDDPKDSTTTTTKDSKDGPSDSGSTPTTTKDSKDDPKDSTSTTTSKDSKDDPKDSTSTTSEPDSKDSTPTTVDKKMTTAAVKGGATTDTSSDKADSTSKGDSRKPSGSKDGCDPAPDKGGKDSGGKDSGGKDSTTDTTRKSGDKSGGKDTTDTTRRPTTSTTEKRDTVEPSTPSDSGGPAPGGTDSGSSDPGATPIEPQEAPPAYDSGPSDPAAANDGDYDDMPDEGPVPSDEDEVAIGPMAAPGEAAPVLPSFGTGFYDGTGSKPPAPAKQRSRSSGAQQVASAPLVMSGSGYVQASPGLTESAAVSRNLAGLQSSKTESAFPADIISTPRVFPTNRRDPLAAGALVLLIGVGRELFKAWRRQANDYWVA